jgi:hypothetical protein
LRILRALNKEGIPGPGGGIWYDSAIRGQPLRGDGVLRNQTYIGRLVWNRRNSIKDPSTGRRVRRGGDPDAVVNQEAPHLQIIKQDLWYRVSQRLAAEALPTDGLTKTGSWTRRRPRHLLTGKVFCGCCGAATVLSGKDYIGCRTAKYGGCRNTSMIRRGIIGARVLTALGGQPMQPDLLDDFLATYNEEWKRLAAESKARADTNRRERTSIERKIANLVDAVANGKASPSLMARIEELERQLAGIQVERCAAAAKPPSLHPGLAINYRRKVAELGSTLIQGSDQAALEAARALIDRVFLYPPEIDGDPPGVELIGELMAMLAAAGATPPQAARSDVRQGADPFALFVSSVKGAPGAWPLAGPGRARSFACAYILPPARALAAISFTSLRVMASPKA